MAHKNRIRRLPPGSPIPNDEPRIYPTSDGYRVWRWKVGPYTYVEALEHRISEGRVTTAQNVHHRNHDRSDNTSTNLQGISAAEHSRYHNTKIDYEAAWSLYQTGLGTIEVGKRFGVHAATLSRGFRSRGWTLRGTWEQRTAERDALLDFDLIRDMHLAGVRASGISRRFGISKWTIRRIIRDLGLAPHPPGRPPL